ncbi:hypothetical protein A2866_02775 [Candidatus Roizmanbacteria bacterium RIFCSPHIGHO2_01_FULL_39_8]|uniref:NADH:ubiquinone oxidoreductase-like 20kDa subunit domain-containing protein n=3 Tax=Candidatus Roizmaniibacteriota TaxID=1752723 RepID=A0A1F7GPZ7_9BACT|nr:MAG: hypothetical protein A2866_02775 [Candidatus Roizmanbacteria bacterium RIFCSPHIGHO2_01_FULL_39_8]OGK25477.1 MAG: hypothetical protein A3C28_01020 [Candidatus Roizmanbacteria bacterium RIFCSPHIGHO2_02_FULL_39_9]OGK38037.1 MAG: hypothetical protein A3F60_03355 [Candidatus Roizmanbacteria bacterium RIFCSPHIGHO2_12_FULL_39_8]
MADKIRVGWFTFTCCEDSTIIFTELLNSYYRDWMKKIDFVHAKILRKDSYSELQPMDLAFVEGAITSDTQEVKLKKIREKSKKLVAIGACAVIGSPSNQRNFFNPKQHEQIQSILEKFKYKDKVLKLSDIVVVDENVPGCPMDEVGFLNILNKYINSQLVYPEP